MERRVKISLITILLLLAGGGLFAQHKHEFSLYGEGSLPTLNYKSAFGEQKFFFFTPKRGLETGTEIVFYKLWFNMDNFNFRYLTNYIGGIAFEFRSAIDSYKEKQRAMLLQIPLMPQFQTNKPDQQFFLAVGGKAGIPLNVPD